MRPRVLLVTFDAWKTLFTPREAIPAQYTRIARQHGVNAEESDVQKNFKKAFKALSEKFPNYGKDVGMKSEEWWTTVIRSTFSPTILPPSLAPALLSHFATSSAYILHTSVPFLLHSLRSNTMYSHTIIGVVSNSDSRVPLILRDLGITVRNYPPTQRRDIEAGKNGEIDFVTLSYDIGFQKPDPRIFEAALAEAKRLEEEDNVEWVKVHVGDDFEKDFQAAEKAGWRGVFWDGEGRPEEILNEILG
ncbi:HAD-superfamily hydrolase [Wilcoxina mikolae CBS 423.85]|nr:HAD-superfamily hydrolase [Wilcoxina mikolae CBS 423.85]